MSNLSHIYASTYIVKILNFLVFYSVYAIRPANELALLANVEVISAALAVALLLELPTRLIRHIQNEILFKKILVYILRRIRIGYYISIALLPLLFIYDYAFIFSYVLAGAVHGLIVLLHQTGSSQLRLYAHAAFFPGLMLITAVMLRDFHLSNIIAISSNFYLLVVLILFFQLGSRAKKWRPPLNIDIDWSLIINAFTSALILAIPIVAVTYLHSGQQLTTFIFAAKVFNIFWGVIGTPTRRFLILDRFSGEQYASRFKVLLILLAFPVFSIVINHLLPSFSLYIIFFAIIYCARIWNLFVWNELLAADAIKIAIISDVFVLFVGVVYCYFFQGSMSMGTNLILLSTLLFIRPMLPLTAISAIIFPNRNAVLLFAGILLIYLALLASGIFQLATEYTL